MVGIFIFGVSPAVFADDASDQAAQLVSQAESFRKEAKKEAPPTEEKPEIEVEKEKEAAPEEAGPSFQVKKINLEENSLFLKELREMVSPLEGKTITFGALRQAAQKITGLYRSRGYLTSRAYIPPQRLEDGIVTIKIIEGNVGRIHVEGNKFFKSALYEEAIRLRKDRVFRYEDLESSLYFLNLKPDRKAKAYLISGEEPATSDIILKATDSNPFHLSYEFNNHGTKFTHRARHLVFMEHNNISGNGDTFLSSVSMAEEGAFDAVAGSYSLPFERTGTTLSMDASLVESMLVRHLKSAEIKGEYKSLSFGVTQNFMKRPSFVLDGVMGFDIKDSKTLVDDFKTSYDRMRVLKAGPRLAFQDKGGRTSLSFFVHQGLPDFMGGSGENDPNASRENAGGDFTSYTASVTRIQRLPNQWYLILRGNGQWTRDTLTSVEQFRLGGAYSVRGYTEAEASGDYGYNGSAELSVPLWSKALRFVGFVDVGKTYLRERPLNATVKDKFLLGTGFGVRVNLDRTLSLQADLGWPIGDDSTDENQMQVHIAVRGGF